MTCCILTHAWDPERGLQHVISYSDKDAEAKRVSGVLDYYAFTANACLDAYESSSDLSYFTFARRIADYMIRYFYDGTSGGFFDTEQRGEQGALGVLGTRRKPFQDSPTPAGNSVASIVMSRLYSYTSEASYRDCAEQTLELLAGLAGQYGLFAATYGLAAVQFASPHIQVVIIGDNEIAADFYRTAIGTYASNKTVLRMKASEVVPQSLPPTLAQSIPNLPAIKEGKTVGVICSGFTCQAPTSDPGEFRDRIAELFVSSAQK